jgi:hypothetical protein
MPATIPYADIADEALRTQLQSLGLVIPHLESKIDARIGEYDLPFYHKLLAMEAYTYDRSDRQAGSVEYAPYWLVFNTALMGYVNHAPLPAQTVKNVISGLFGFLSVHYGHGAGDASTLVNSNAKAIFVMGGFIETTLSRPLSYYDDFIVADPLATPEPTPASSPRLEAEPDILDVAWPLDAAKVNVLLTQYSDAISDVAINAMFQNIDPNGTSPTPVETWEAIFVDLSWKWFITHFGSSVSIPPKPPG